jgi:hypothetical protein
MTTKTKSRILEAVHESGDVSSDSRVPHETA